MPVIAERSWIVNDDSPDEGGTIIVRGGRTAIMVEPNKKIKVHRIGDPSGGLTAHVIIEQCTRLADLSDLTPVQRDAFMRLVLLIFTKLSSVYMQTTDYLRRESALIDEAVAEPLDDYPDILITHIDLFLFFDIFLVQVKSALDYLTQTLPFGITHAGGTPTTFGSGGKVVATFLRKHADREIVPAKKEAAESLIRLIEINDGWLEKTIASRDKMNHYIDKGFDLHEFSVFSIKREDGTSLLRRPSIDETPISEIMKLVLNNSLRFIEAFLVMTIAPMITKRAVVHHKRDPKGEQHFAMMEWAELDSLLAVGKATPNGVLNLLVTRSA